MTKSCLRACTKIPNHIINSNNKISGWSNVAWIKTEISDIVYTTRFWNYRYQKRSNDLKSVRVDKPKGWFMGFNATFNNISAISWRSVLLVEETGVLEEHHCDLSQVTDKRCMEYTSPWTGFKVTTFSGDRHWLHI